MKKQNKKKTQISQEKKDTRGVFFFHIYTGRNVQGHVISALQITIQHYGLAKEETEYF